MPEHAAARVSSVDLDTLMNVLEVQLVSMSEALVEPSYTMRFEASQGTALLYCHLGRGRISVGDAAPVDFGANTLIIAPANCHIKVEGSSQIGMPTASESILVRAVSARSEAPAPSLLFGHFNARYGATIDLFGALEAPIVEQFAASDRLELSLRAALREFASHEVGSDVMTATLLKQVIVLVIRRSLGSSHRWVERFSMLKDLRIAHALAEMVSRPGGRHSVESLSRAACLSRSAFMLRFNNLVGTSPMAILRDLRMRQAAQQLETHNHSVDQVSHNAGYESVSSFLRAFRNTYGIDPSQYRASSKTAYRSCEPSRAIHALAA